MNNKLLLAASALIMSAAVSTPAFAGCDGFYLAGRGGVINHNVGDNDSKLTDDKLDIDDNSMMFSGALGYRWGYFRVEAEYVWREDSDSSKFSPALNTSNREEFESKSYMANIYWDLSPYTWFTPYVSAGIGITEMNFSSRLTDYDTGTTRKSNDYDESNFTWSVGGGLSAQVTNRFNVDVGYRYYDMGDIGEASIHAHEVYGGLRYVF